MRTIVSVAKYQDLMQNGYALAAPCEGQKKPSPEETVRRF
jgi:hypothetical protein